MTENDSADTEFKTQKVESGFPPSVHPSAPHGDDDDEQNDTRRDADQPGFASTMVAPGGSVLAAERPPLLPGMMFHHYQLIRELGRGGMGAVFLARDTRLGRRVAVKFLVPKDDSGVARFLSEARATARCEHDNIVSIYHADEAMGYLYMVLEYIEGLTLSQWMRLRWRGHRGGAHGKRAPLERAATDLAANDGAVHPPQAPYTTVSPSLAVELMVPVVRALVHAHAHGLVHRDLKPANIMLTDDGVIKVLDFGVAKLLDNRVLSPVTGDGVCNDAGPKTGAGAVLGTAPYMSPEQWGADDVDARSDIWAVGLIFWKLCVGRHPLSPLTHERLLSVVDLDIPMPSILQQRADLGRLADIIDHCLVKKKSERAPSAADLLQALEPLLPTHSRMQSAANGAEAPYVGLAAFRESDADRFFGRDREIAAMLGRVRHHRLITVTGASGAGKSSFVRAGVIPALARSGQAWEWFIVRPGRHPLAGLASILNQLRSQWSADSNRCISDRSGAEHSDASVSQRSGVSELDDLTLVNSQSAAQINALRNQPGCLGTALRARCYRRRTNILLFVDQFEEIYTLGIDRDTREAFVRCLEGVADDVSSPLRVILSVRADFLDRIAEDRGFMSEITRGLWFIPPMARAELRQALLQPLRAVGYQLEPDTPLAEAMLDSVADTRAPLPLLQFTAAKLWNMRDRRQKYISYATYQRLGGVAGALSAHADTVFAGLSENEQRVARNIFSSLVTDERTRAVVSLDELCAMASVEPLQDPSTQADDAVESMVYILAEARLLLIETGGHTGSVTVEISHESLIERWPRLGQWLSADQEEGAFRARLRAAAQQWDKAGRIEDLLWRGEAATDAVRWLERWRGADHHHSGQPARGMASGAAKPRARGGDKYDEISLDMAYIRAVTGLKSRTRRWRRLMVAAAFAAVCLVAGVVSILAVHADKMAEEAAVQAALAREQVVIADAESMQARNASRMASAREFQSESSSDPTLVLSLVREMEVPGTLPGTLPGSLPQRWRELARWALHQGVAEVVLKHPDSVYRAAFSPNGSHVVAASRDASAWVWRTDGTGTAVRLKGHQSRVYAAAFSPDGGRIVTASEDKTALVWRADGTGIPVVLRGHDEFVNGVAFSPDRRL